MEAARRQQDVFLVHGSSQRMSSKAAGAIGAGVDSSEAAAAVTAPALTDVKDRLPSDLDGLESKA
jgi:hypothetical protein